MKPAAWARQSGKQRVPPYSTYRGLPPHEGRADALKKPPVFGSRTIEPVDNNIPHSQSIGMLASIRPVALLTREGGRREITLPEGNPVRRSAGKPGP